MRSKRDDLNVGLDIRILQELRVFLLESQGICSIFIPVGKLKEQERLHLLLRRTLAVITCTRYSEADTV